MMPRFVSLGLLAVVAALPACSGALDPGPGGPLFPMTRLRAEPYSFSTNSGLGTAERLVIRDAGSWQSVWNRIHASRTPMPSVPQIDFAREMIVVAAMGSRPTGGYTLLLEQANEDPADGIVVSVRSISPGRNCVVTLALTAPVDIARLPLHAGQVRFFERSETKNC